MAAASWRGPHPSKLTTTGDLLPDFSKVWIRSLLQRLLHSTGLPDHLQGKLQTHKRFTWWQNDVKTLHFASAVHSLVQSQDIISELLQGCSSLLLLKDKRWGLIQTQLKSAEKTPTVAAFSRLFKGIKFQSLGVSFIYHKLCLQFCPLQ